MSDPRSDLLEVYLDAVGAVQGRTAVSKWIDEHPLVWQDCALLSVGKAAVSMAQGAVDALPGQINSGLLITKNESLKSSKGLPETYTLIQGDHPIPGEKSLAAGRALIEYIGELPTDLPLLALVSGGASSLLELPVVGVEVEDLARANGWLLASGLPIDQINQVRRGLSRLKGGGLAALLEDRPFLGLFISDVEGDDPAVIGSGLLTRSGADCYDNLDLPDWLESFIDSSEQADSMPAKKSDCVIVASLTMARRAAVRKAAKLGYQVVEHERFLKGEATAIGLHLVAEMQAKPGYLHVWGGETTVTLPENPGRGGRCQALALASATELGKIGRGWLLAAGTDGGDGPGEDAGALVDAGTLARAKDDLFDAEDSLLRADSGSFLEASGDLIYTGATGTNVTDLVLGYIPKAD